MLVDLIKKYIPVGTKLWSPLFGDCTLDRIHDADHPEYFILHYGDDFYISMTQEGKYNSKGKVMVFPSEDVQTWEVLSFIDKNAKDGGLYCIKDKKGKDFIGRFKGITACKVYFYYIEKDDTSIVLDTSIPLNELTSMRDASPELSKLHQDMLKLKGLRWESSHNTLHRFCFNPLQKVLVRNEENEPWRIDLFQYYREGYEYSYFCIGKLYKYCIPYEGNEHLLNQI